MRRPVTTIIITTITRIITGRRFTSVWVTAGIILEAIIITAVVVIPAGTWVDSRADTWAVGLAEQSTVVAEADMWAALAGAGTRAGLAAAGMVEADAVN
jgi:hypothetical protein